MTKGSTWSILCCRLMHVPHTGCNVRFGSKADMYDAKRHVRFTPKSGHVRCTGPCPLCDNSGHWHGSLERLGSSYLSAQPNAAPYCRFQCGQRIR